MRNKARRIGVILLVVLMFMSLCKVQEASVAKSSAKKKYASVLKKSRYKTATFAVQDLNHDGTPELMICRNGLFLDQLVFTCKMGKLKKIKGVTYPMYGALCVSKKSGDYVFYRGGPAMDDYNPIVMVQYKLKNSRIKEVNTYSARTACVDEAFFKNGKKISKKKFFAVRKKYTKEVNFYENTAQNRKKLGV